MAMHLFLLGSLNGDRLGDKMHFELRDRKSKFSKRKPKFQPSNVNIKISASSLFLCCQVKVWCPCHLHMKLLILDDDHPFHKREKVLSSFSMLAAFTFGFDGNGIAQGCGGGGVFIDLRRSPNFSPFYNPLSQRE